MQDGGSNRRAPVECPSEILSESLYETDSKINCKANENIEFMCKSFWTAKTFQLSIVPWRKSYSLKQTEQHKCKTNTTVSMHVKSTRVENLL